MDKNQNILDEVKNTISLLDNVKNIEPSPFLYFRIKANVDSGLKNSKSIFNYVSLKTLKRAVLIVLLVFNLLGIISFLSFEDQTSQSRNSYVNTIHAEYSLNTETDYLTLIAKGN